MMGSLPETFFEMKVLSFWNKDVKLFFVRFRLRIETARQAAQSSALIFQVCWTYKQALCGIRIYLKKRNREWKG